MTLRAAKCSEMKNKETVNEGKHVLRFCERYRICHLVVPNKTDLFLLPMYKRRSFRNKECNAIMYFHIKKMTFTTVLLTYS